MNSLPGGREEKLWKWSVVIGWFAYWLEWMHLNWIVKMSDRGMRTLTPPWRAWDPFLPPLSIPNYVFPECSWAHLIPNSLLLCNLQYYGGVNCAGAEIRPPRSCDKFGSRKSWFPFGISILLQAHSNSYGIPLKSLHYSVSVEKKSNGDAWGWGWKGPWWCHKSLLSLPLSHTVPSLSMQTLNPLLPTPI